MISIQTKTRVAADETLTVQVPTDLPETEVEVMLVVQPIAARPEELDWPEGFFEETYGSLKDDPIERAPQGELEVREALQ